MFIIHSTQHTAHSTQHIPNLIDNDVIDRNQYPRCLFKSSYLSNLFYLILLLPLFTINSSHAALSAQTVKVITGTAPYFLSIRDNKSSFELSELAEIEMPRRDGNSGIETINIKTSVIDAPIGMKFSDVKVLKGYVIANSKVHSYPEKFQHDIDGDIYVPKGTITAEWRDEKGKLIQDLGQTLAICGQSFSYTLNIKVKDLTAAAYGIPSVGTNYGSFTKSYVFRGSHAGICYFKPLSMVTFKGTAGSNVKFKDGYNPDVWSLDKGFSIAKMKATGKLFPLTGFDRASFDLIMEQNDQSDIECYLESGTWIKLSGAGSRDLGKNCRITVYSKLKPTTKSVVGVRKRTPDGKSWVNIDTYTLNPPKKWAIAGGIEKYHSHYADGSWVKSRMYGKKSKGVVFPVLDMCRRYGSKANPGKTSWQQANGQNPEDRAWRQQYLYRREEITNSPFADSIKYPENSSPRVIEANYFSRDVDGTFMGEWGNLRYDYPGSGWTQDDWYWTAEAADNDHQFYVIGHGGRISWGPDYNYNDVTICRGE